MFTCLTATAVPYIVDTATPAAAVNCMDTSIATFQYGVSVCTYTGTTYAITTVPTTQDAATGLYWTQTAAATTNYCGKALATANPGCATCTSTGASAYTIACATA